MNRVTFTHFTLPYLLGMFFTWYKQCKYMDRESSVNYLQVDLNLQTDKLKWGSKFRISFVEEKESIYDLN